MNSVLVAARDAQLAERWLAELAASGQWSLLPAVTSNAQARAALARSDPVLLVTDLRLLDGATSDLIRALQYRGAGRRVHTLVVCDGGEDPLVLEALQAGADNFFSPAGAPAGALAAGARDTVDGGAHVAPWVARRLLEHFGVAPNERQNAVEELASPLALNADERALLRRLSAGHLLGELASAEGVAARAVVARLRTIYRKMQWMLRAGDLTLT